MEETQQKDSKNSGMGPPDLKECFIFFGVSGLFFAFFILNIVQPERPMIVLFLSALLFWFSFCVGLIGVGEREAFRIGSYWFAPSRIISSTREDEAEKKRINNRNAAKAKALAAGLTLEEIEALK